MLNNTRSAHEFDVNTTANEVLLAEVRKFGISPSLREENLVRRAVNVTRSDQIRRPHQKASSFTPSQLRSSGVKTWFHT